MSGPSQNPLKRIIGEIHRRHVWQVFVVYSGTSYAILEALDLFIERIGLPVWVFHGTAVLLLFGLPVILVTAYLQPEALPDWSAPGSRDDGRNDEKEPLHHAAWESESARRWAATRLFTWRNAIAGGTMAFALWGVIAAGWVLFGAGLPAATNSSDEAASLHSIAVLPFQNLSENSPHDYFAGGLHDELLTQLFKIDALTVMGRTSVISYADTETPLQEIAEELGVGSIVEGSVQVLGDRLRVNVQLLDAETGSQIWAERYDRTLEDAFAVQSEIAERVVREVGAEITGAEARAIARAPTDNAEAYRFYLQGEEYRLRPGILPRNLRIAQQLYERAIDLDPDFALAHARLAEVHGMLYWFRHDPSPERAALLRDEADAALRLAPDMPEAHVAMAQAHLWGRRDFRRALEEFEIALEGLPNAARIWYYYGAVHRRLGHWDDALTAFEEAARLDPRDALIFYDIGGATYWVTHRYPQAIREFERASTIAPDLYVAAVGKAIIYLVWRGQVDTLRAVVDRLPPNETLGVNAGTAAGERARLLLYERKADSLLSLIENSPTSVFANELEYLPTSIYAAWARQLRNEEVQARRAFESALSVLDSAPEELSDEWRLHAARGLALAGLGRRGEALRTAHSIAQSEVYHNDVFFRPILREYRAKILAQAGEADAALDDIERLVAGPSFYVTAPTLELSPLWDSIRDHHRFQALLKEYEDVRF